MVKLTRMFPLLALIVGVVLPTLPAEGLDPGQTQINGQSATGIQRPPGNTGATVIGLHNPSPVNNALSPCRTFATLFAVINTDVGLLLGSDVLGTQDGAVLPLDNLRSNPGQTCIYREDFPLGDDPIGPLGVVGPRRVELSLGKKTGNTFSFQLEYREGTYVNFTGLTPTTPTFPCPARVPLATAFLLHGGAPNAIFVKGVASWENWGNDNEPCNFLRDP